MLMNHTNRTLLGCCGGTGTFNVCMIILILPPECHIMETHGVAERIHYHPRQTTADCAANYSPSNRVWDDTVRLKAAGATTASAL